MTDKQLPPVDEVRRMLSYDAATGELWWIGRPSKRTKPGHRAGFSEKDGYRRVNLKGKSYLSHRLAWLLYYGEWPTAYIDHINGRRDDNRIENLRLATATENSQNHRISCKNKSGRTGVLFVPRSGRYKATIGFEHYTVHLGYFATLEAADAAYKEAKQRFHVFNPIQRDSQQPDAARGEQPARDGVSDVVIGAAFLAVLRDPKIAWRETEAQPFIDRVSAEAARLAANQPPQQADGGAVGEIIANYETDTGTETVASITKPVPVGAKLYLRPTRGVEVTEEILEGLRLADQFFDGQDEVWQWDDGEWFPGSKVRAAYQAALSGVQRWR